MTTIVVTSAGSGVSSAIVEACSVTGRSVQLVGLTTDLDTARHAGFDDVRLCPPTGVTAMFQRAVLQDAAALEADLVLAGRDDDVIALAAIADQLDVGRPRWSGVVAELGAWGRDKLRVATYLRAAGVNAAATVDEWGALDLVARHGYPVVVKPRYGDGSRGAVLARDDQELRQALNSPRRMVVQPFLASAGVPLPTGPMLEQHDEFSLQMVVGEGWLAGPFATRNRLEDGYPVEAVAVHRRALERLGHEVVHAMSELGLRGSVNVQARETAPERFEIFELNFRCTGLTGVRAQMGFDEVGALLGERPPANAAQYATARGWVARRRHPAARHFELTSEPEPCVSR